MGGRENPSASDPKIKVARCGREVRNFLEAKEQSESAENIDWARERGP